jgi:hypothetical protein
MSIGADGATVELDTARIVAAVADALLWVGRSRRTASCYLMEPSPMAGIVGGGSR